MIEMVDSVVSFLLQNLSRLLEDEHKLVSGVEDKVNLLRNELKFIDIFLKNSEGKRNNNIVREVVSQIRDVAYKAEDVVDIYIANISRHRRRNVVSKIFHSKERFAALHSVHTEINKIKSSIDEIYKNKERYDIEEGEFKSKELNAAESMHKRRRDVEEEDIVGLLHDSTEVIQQLLESDSRRKVVSIIGMGGLGKTTLARKIYNKDQVKELFPCRAWGYVSNDYRARELLLSLLMCLFSTSEYNDLFEKRQYEAKADAISEEKLKKKLREWLKGKKYLIVLDDIWNTQVWDEVKGAFPDDENGSRILITSRINEVANYTGTASPCYLPLLNEQESWELFSKKVFGGEDCPPDLESVGRSIVETCGGLPLAIVVLAGLVAKKEKTEREWKRIKEVSWHLTKDKTQVMDILKLSYDGLPQRLKPCFLYFGIYPEDYEINARQLIKLWTAEGFIETEEAGILKEVEAEDIADYYLDELVDRSLVQAASRRTDGGVKTCRIHDLLRDLCISESKSEKFLEVCTEAKNMDTLSNANPPRRLSFHCQVESNVSSSKINQCCTRSLFFFAGGADWALYKIALLKNFKLVRLIYGIEGECHQRPSDMKKLIHLRYLKVHVNDIPSCISCLYNLETLDVCYKGTASSEIWKLKRLRHLYLRGKSTRAKLPMLAKANSERERNLQTLWLMSDDPQVESLVKKTIFPKLRKLVLYNILGRELWVPTLQHLSNLHCLKVRDCAKLPSKVNEFPPSLTKITLKNVGDAEFFFRKMKTLRLLANLQILKLEGNHSVLPWIELNIGSGEFPQLQVFQMINFRARLWRMEEGAMPHLRHLVIDHCGSLIEFPQQLWSVTTLRKVHVLNPTRGLACYLQNMKLKINDCEILITERP